MAERKKRREDVFLYGWPEQQEREQLVRHGRSFFWSAVAAICGAVSFLAACVMAYRGWM